MQLFSNGTDIFDHIIMYFYFIYVSKLWLINDCNCNDDDDDDSFA